MGKHRYITILYSLYLSHNFIGYIVYIMMMIITMIHLHPNIFFGLTGAGGHMKQCGLTRPNSVGVFFAVGVI